VDVLCVGLGLNINKISDLPSEEFLSSSTENFEDEKKKKKKRRKKRTNKNEHFFI